LRAANQQITNQRITNQQITNQRITNHEFAIRLALFRDRAFTFYYPENLEALAAAGAELVFVDAFRDATLPNVHALYIGGGFPEIFMAELSANASLRASVKAAAAAGLPIYAECGGLMYLARRITWGERSAEMAGVLPCDVEMTGRPQGHGYVEAVVDADNPFFPVGAVMRGHEFHNSRLIPHVPGTCEVPGTFDGVPTAYRLTRGNGIGEGRDGLVYRNVLASYTHLHAAGAPAWASGLIARAHELARSDARAARPVVPDAGQSQGRTGRR
jgi:cobyrinic acid a,c-diamide synthase